MNKRHDKAVDMISKEVKPIRVSESSWEVHSPSDFSTRFMVQRLTHSCSCKLKCHRCGVCSESYTCTCVDYALHSTACKNIHCVCVTLQSDQTITTKHTNIDAIPQHAHRPQNIDRSIPTQMDKVKRNIRSKVLEIQTLSRNADSLYSLNAALSLPWY